MDLAIVCTRLRRQLRQPRQKTRLPAAAAVPRDGDRDYGRATSADPADLEDGDDRGAERIAVRLHLGRMLSAPSCERVGGDLTNHLGGCASRNSTSGEIIDRVNQRQCDERAEE